MKRTRKPPPPLEKAVQKAGIALLRAMGFTVHRRNVRVMRVPGKDGRSRLMKFGEAGQSDTWGTLPDGRRFELEFKRLGKRPTPSQLVWLKSQNGPHCVAFWVDNCATLGHVAGYLKRGWGVSYGEDDYYELTDL